MGVPGLQSFIEKRFSARIPIIKAAQEYKKSTGLRPILLIDQSNFLIRFYDLAVIYPVIGGGESITPMKAYIKFLRQLQENDIEVVFVAEGLADDTRIEVQLERNVKRLEIVTKFYEGIEKWAPCKGQTPKAANMFMYLAKIHNREKGLIYRETLMEGDNAILKYIDQHGCFGIISGDSDLMLCQNIPYIFSPQNLSLKDLTTTFITSQHLSWFLNLNPSLFPIFATLCGNDKVKPSDLRKFHLRLLGDHPQFSSLQHREYLPRFDVFDGVTRFLNSYLGNHSNYENIAQIIELEHLAPMIRKSCESYSYNEKNAASLDEDNLTPSESWNSILKAARKNYVAPFGLMVQLRYCMGNSLQIYDNPKYPCDVLVIQKQMFRYYGYLFAERPKSLGPVEVVEYMNCGKCYPSPNIAIPENPDKIISLLTLWDPECAEDLKWEAFCWIVDPQLNASEVMKLPRPLVVPAFAVYLMCFAKQHYEEPWVADALVAQVARMLTATESEVEKLKCGRINGPSIHIATVYMQICLKLYSISEACGSPVGQHQHLDVPFFDAKLYNNSRDNIQNGVSGASLCEYSPEVADGYKNVMDFLNKNKRVAKEAETTKQPTRKTFVPIVDLEKRYPNLRF